MKEALFYEKQNNLTVKCLLCPHNCQIKNNEFGFCRVRTNIGGKLFLPYYGILSAIALDPIEKKPLMRFKPGAKILSVGGYGCNLRCMWCQNHEISMNVPDTTHRYYPPEIIADTALRYVPEGNIGAAYTYNEPFIHYEYVLNCAKKVKELNLHNILVTNGFITEEALLGLLPYISAMNIDLKGFTGEFYRKISGDLRHVKNVIKIAAKSCHTELTTLIIPGENDTLTETEEAAKWIAEINENIPLHLTRFFPRYKYADKNPTEKIKILELKKAAQKYLKYVYAGNIG
jgi:pyruvate formate lyase activating enzyme